MSQDEKPKDTTIQNMKRMLLVTLSAGLLTFVIAGLALLIGLSIDSRAGTLPRWTLILLLGSAPFSFGGVYLIARRAVRRMREKRGDEVQVMEDGDE